jgi:hypothetical protein
MACSGVSFQPTMLAFQLPVMRSNVSGYERLVTVYLSVNSGAQSGNPSADDEDGF